MLSFFIAAEYNGNRRTAYVFEMDADSNHPL